MKTRVICHGAILLLVACTDLATETHRLARTRVAPASVISDAAHAGLDGFYFLPPMVNSPTVTGVFDADIGTLDPEIVICESAVPNEDCGVSVASLATFNRSTSPAVTIDEAIQQYHVNWNTQGPGFSAPNTYRLHVRAGTAQSRRELGFADILLTDTPGHAKNITSGDYIVLQDGRTLPIKFRIETGIVGGVTMTVTPAEVRAGTGAIASANVRDLHGEALSGNTVEWSSSGAAVILASLSGTTDANGAHATTVTAGSTAGVARITVTSVGLSASADLNIVPAIIDRSDVLASMNVSRTGSMVVSEGGLLYAIGGLRNVIGVQNANEAYDPATNQWSSRTPLPTARLYGAAAAVDGIIYVIGGTPGGSCCATVATVEAYDPATDTWTTKAPMLSMREQFGVAVHDGIIYVIGGWKPGPGHFADVEAYDPNTNTWTARAPMPAARSGHGAATVNGKVYVVGGWSSTFQAQTLEYDPSTNSWATRASIPTPRTRLGAAAAGGLVYAVGGFTGGGNGGVTTIEAYDPLTNTWSTKAGLNIPRWALGVTSLSDLVFAVGGTRETVDLSELEVYRP